MSRPHAIPEWLLPMAVIALAVLLGSEFVVAPWVVAGRSMEPALLQGDRVLIDRWTYRQRPPRVGEVALIVGPRSTPMVKRVAAPPSRIEPPPAGWSWVVGDNREASADSRRFGPLAPERIRGRVLWRYWPPSRVGPVR